MPQARRGSAAARVSALLAAGLAAGAVHAAGMGQAVYDGAKQEVRSVYKAERQGCDQQQGADRKVCLTSADGREKIAVAYLDYSFSGLEKDQHKLYEAAYTARYDLARAKCAALSGREQDLCEQQAKTERDKSKADEKFSQKVMQALNDQQAEHLKADYKLAMQQCDLRSGDDKSVCQAATKARFYGR